MHGAYLLYVCRDKPLKYSICSKYIFSTIVFTPHVLVGSSCLIKNFLTSVKILSKKDVSCCSDGDKEGVDE